MGATHVARIRILMMKVMSSIPERLRSQCGRAQRQTLVPVVFIGDDELCHRMKGLHALNVVNVFDDGSAQHDTERDERNGTHLLRCTKSRILSDGDDRSTDLHACEHGHHHTYTAATPLHLLLDLLTQRLLVPARSQHRAHITATADLF